MLSGLSRITVRLASDCCPESIGNPVRLPRMRTQLARWTRSLRRAGQHRAVADVRLPGDTVVETRMICAPLLGYLQRQAWARSSLRPTHPIDAAAPSSTTTNVTSRPGAPRVACPYPEAAGSSRRLARVDLSINLPLSHEKPTQCKARACCASAVDVLKRAALQRIALNHLIEMNLNSPQRPSFAKS